MTLYTMEILEILSRESENTQHVYVYEENGRWYAYERSAQLVKYLLAELLKIVCFVCVPHPTYSVVCEDSGKRVGIFSQNVLFRIFQTRIFGGNKIQNN